ncbi:MAG: hypothetical protein AABO58_05595 [Acidobacteriota bacterium]
MPARDSLHSAWREIAGAIVVLITRILTAPKSPWELDELLFTQAVRKFDPSNYHPHPPGYPLYVLLGKAFHLIVDDPWRALVVLAIVAAPVGFVALARAFRNWTGDAGLAVAGALLYYFSASMLVHGTLALSDGASLAFLALALHAVSVTPSVSEGPGGTGGAQNDVQGATPAPRSLPFAFAQGRDDGHQRNAIAIGLWSSAAIGCRPQLLLPMIPMLAIVLWRMPSKRQRVAAVASFAFVSLMWFLPLVDAAGGVRNVIAYETKQAAYVASHDAAMSRGSKSFAEIVVRFVLHPWGSKYITLPLFLCVALGVPAFIRRARALLPLIVFTAVQLAFELFLMDPADGARYSLPSMILVALIAALGFDVIRRSVHFRAAPYIAAALFAAMAWWYVAPIVGPRTTRPSPPVEAAQYANGRFAPGTVILYDGALKPHAEYLFARFKPMPIETGLAAFYDRAEVPLVQFVDGGSKVAEARTFWWPPSDAYGKLTRNLYREVSLDPVRPQERYLPLRGVYPLERTIAGDEWRWLERESAIRVPVMARTAVLAFALSPDTPYESTNVQVSVDGRDPHSIAVKKGDVARVSVWLPFTPYAEIGISAQQAFLPATVLHNQDPRTLAVQLKSVEQH